jgi:hypothetical protein
MTPRGVPTDFTFTANIILGLSTLVEYTGITTTPPTWRDTSHGLCSPNSSDHQQAITINAAAGTARFRIEDVEMPTGFGGTSKTTVSLDLDLQVT